MSEVQDTPTVAPHTPGPWTVNIVEARGGGSYGYIKADTGHREIAVLYNDEQQAANAHLIAAAPDLLAACRALINAPHHEHFAVRLNDAELAGVEAIQWAIAKAEGR